MRRLGRKLPSITPSRRSERGAGDPPRRQTQGGSLWFQHAWRSDLISIDKTLQTKKQSKRHLPTGMYNSWFSRRPANILLLKSLIFLPTFAFLIRTPRSPAPLYFRPWMDRSMGLQRIRARADEEGPTRPLHVPVGDHQWTSRPQVEPMAREKGPKKHGAVYARTTPLCHKGSILLHYIIKLPSPNILTSARCSFL